MKNRANHITTLLTIGLSSQDVPEPARHVHRPEEMTMEAWTTDPTAKVRVASGETSSPAAETPDQDWIAELRDGIDVPGQYLAYRGSDGDVIAFSLDREWTRIGRSLAADIRFDDPTVSRRHALIVRQPDGLRVVDDRSLNGVFVNGERVEWSALADGDEIVIGRHHLHFCEISVTVAMALAPAAEPNPA
jgi:pSer/pThr/pTyr-binding forkhead associated (FHA) protein